MKRPKNLDYGFQKAVERNLLKMLIKERVSEKSKRYILKDGSITPFS